ncbi:MAG: Calcineurin-like phosphoesterase superfamily domain protein [Methanoregula sp. PtaU1.Bin051]|nr:MAG: Calcineurin-like phosphoesterase superfamily domain protein [Methanoregula sp. PtaU1.Bin051]
MGAVIFSDVHADAGAIAAFRSCIREPIFTEQFGPVDLIVNLGDLLHRGDHPEEVLKAVHAISREYKLVSVMGNHDHAFLNGLPVSGSDAASLYRHERLKGSPYLSIFDGMPMEWTTDEILFVHGGPMELGNSTLRLKFWQRLSRRSGDTFAGYNYTPAMAFSVLKERGLKHLCCGHQHTSLCCRNQPNGIRNYCLDYIPVPCSIGSGFSQLESALVSLDIPAILRVGACSGRSPEFAYTDFTTFWFLRIS